MNSHHHSHLRAIMFAVAGFTCWVIGDMFLKLADELSVPPYEIMAIGGCGGMAMIFAVTASRGEIPKLRPHKYGALAALGLMFLINYGVWLTALARLPLANFYTVIFMAPTVGALFAALFLREHLNLQKILAIVAGFIGVLIAINPARLIGDKGDWIGYGAAGIGMFVVVSQMLTLRFIGHHESRESTAFYPRIAAVAGGLIGLLIFGCKPLSAAGLLYCIATGGVGGLGWMFIAQAYKMAPAAIVAPFQYSQIISSSIIGYLVWHTVPSAHLLIGAAIIIASGLYIVTHARRAGRLAKELVENP